jgi:hypothetical protein
MINIHLYALENFPDFIVWSLRPAKEIQQDEMGLNP